MRAALDNRLEAKTDFEKFEAETWMRMIMQANARGEDLDQFIPQAEAREDGE